MPLLKRLLKSLLRIALATVLAVIILLLIFQHHLIYHPRPYAAGEETRHRAMVALAYTTAQGRQEAFYLPPRVAPDKPPQRLWVAFPGNGGRALDWHQFIDPPPEPGDGFLLIDYPGYGDCQGSASPGAIEDSAEAAFGCLAESLHTTRGVLEGNLNVLGHSLGAATGLNFAARHPVQRIVLIAPFTTMRAMARRSVGWPLCWLLLHNYDNRARLRELAARPHPPRIAIFHGEDDQFIPVAMGRGLAAMFPGMIAFHPVPGAGHASVLDAWPQIADFMRE